MSDTDDIDQRRGRYPCPRCQRVLRVTHPVEPFLPILFHLVPRNIFRGYVCDYCGPIPFSELPRDAKVIRALMFVATLCLVFMLGVFLYAALVLP